MSGFLVRLNLRRCLASQIRMASDQKKIQCSSTVLALYTANRTTCLGLSHTASHGTGKLGELGKGAGKGGGGGGSVREAGGAFGKREVAEEERYFRQKEKEQMEALRKHHAEEIEHHKKEIERLQKEIDRHKGKIRKLKHDD